MQKHLRTPAPWASRARIALVAVVGLASAGFAGVALPATGSVVEPGAPAPGSAVTKPTTVEVFSPDGSITRRSVRLPVQNEAAPQAAVASAQVVPIEVNGPSASRFDLVFVGDGYTSSQLGTYGQHVRSKWAEIASVEPFRSHRKQFNVWQVNVISPQSGVDNDPRGTYRTTALDMGFWCSNIDRLLCVNETKANQYAASAPDRDQVIALGNSTTYGGAGGGVATASGGNAQSGQVAIHELGHSIGGLADEYTYGGGSCYPYGEPRELNVSRQTVAQMRNSRTKWYRWLGQTSPDGGTVGAYVGARYYTSCIYRPTYNSMMRTLGQQFNLPGREAMIAAFYRETGVVESVDGGALAAAGATPLTARSGALATVKAVGHATVTWRIDGRTVHIGATLDASALRGLRAGRHTVTATAVDNTPWVKDAALRAEFMTRTLSWTIVR